MANTINIPKTHLMMALCLPLAVLLGYLLAEPVESGSIAVVVLVIGVLSVPLLMKWHHPLVVLSWNAWITPAFLPGQPMLWMLMAPVSLLFAVLNRSVKADFRFIQIPTLTRSLLALLAVVGLTAFTTGGIGLRSLGGQSYGGRGYLYIFAAVAGYFAMTSQRIPANRAALFVGLYFISSLTVLVSNIAFKAGPSFYFLYNFFPVGLAVDQAQGEVALEGSGIFRIGGLATAGLGTYCFLLARYGIRDLLRRPVALLFVVAAVAACATSGFRSSLIMFIFTFGTVFFLEGLHRTRLLPLGLVTALTGLAIIFCLSERLPSVVQRAISFLPVKIDPVVKQVAQASTEWRLEIWQRVLPLVPKYFFKGKGYAIDPRELYMGFEGNHIGPANVAYGTILAGDYHNGPLSIIIPFGIFGVLAFGWFLAASLRTLHRYYKFGDPNLKQINTLLLGLFAAKTLFFVVIFGSFYMDLFTFTGIIGLAVSLNGPPIEQPAEESAEDEFPEAAFEGFR